MQEVPDFIDLNIASPVRPQLIGTQMPQGPSTPSLDHLVSAREHGDRDIKAERLRGL